MLFLFIETNYSNYIFLASFFFYANHFLMGPNMKLLQHKNICSLLKDVLKGKAKEDSAKLHKSR